MSSGGGGSGGLSLLIESPPAVAHDNHDDDLFARHARLVDVTDDGLQVFSRDAPNKDVAARLMRIWQERGDFSKVTRKSIEAQQATNDDEQVDGDQDDHRRDKRQNDTLSVNQIKQLSTDVMEQLALARTELATALDLLSVIAPLTDPPTVDTDSLPLEPETLTIVPTVPPPNEATTSSDPNVNPNAKLTLAMSLASIKSSAASFFAAADALLPCTPPDVAEPTASTLSSSVWPTLLHLRTATPYTLVPLGTGPGASLSGKGEARLAKQVGVFYGFQEASELYRKASVAKIRELVLESPIGKEAPRRMVLTVQVGGEEDTVEFECPARHGGQIEAVLDGRRRAAFAEEMFAFLSNEIRNDSLSKARLIMGKRTQGDSIVMEGYDWSFKLKMLSAAEFIAPDRKPSSHRTAYIVLPFLRLLFLQEYNSRRRHSSQTFPSFQQSQTSLATNAGWSRPILQTLSAFLTHRQRLSSIVKVVEEQRRRFVNAASDSGLSQCVEVEYWGAEPAATPRSEADVLARDAGESIERVLRNDKDLGGTIIFRATKTITFQISFSTIVPHIVTPLSLLSNASHQPLTLLAPSFLMVRSAGGDKLGNVASSSVNVTGVPVASVKHLEAFLQEHSDRLIAGLVKD
ncbi:hypothetical protein OIV83_005747 [Microbotryomycetes sp. JL201]|nr:hypothetical protein OIV83_005747 [Microbotryomycetes sp. JL201]